MPELPEVDPTKFSEARQVAYSAVSAFGKLAGQEQLRRV